jgi:hypothetical protein
LLRDSIQAICLLGKVGIISSKSFIIFAIHYFVQNWKKHKNLYCTCEPLLFVKNDKCVDKEYEEANERSIATNRWGCIFLLVRKDNFTWWIGKALLPYTWQSTR